MSLPRSAFCLLVVLVATAGGIASAAPAESRGGDASPAPRLGLVVAETDLPPAAPKLEGNVVLLSNGFEAPWPASPWRVTHPAGAAAVDWGRSAQRASADLHSIWCAGAGSAAPAPGQPVPPGTVSWAIAGPFDLSEATGGYLKFDLWLKTERLHDLFMWLASTDGVTFSGTATTTDTHGWHEVVADLTGLGGAGDVTGQSHVWIALVYQADYSTAFEGAYVDRLRLIADFGSPTVPGITYTSRADFEQGSLVGLDAAGDALALVDTWSGLPYLWLPETSAGVVSRLDVADGAELGRYRTGPDRSLEPAAVAVDLDGSCWVGNRAAGSVVKIGLEERGDCVDRNGNGAIDTSRDANSDGDITGAELLAWGADECVLYEVTTASGALATHVPGDSHDDYADNGLAALAVTAANDLWIAVANDRLLYRLDADSAASSQIIDLANAGLEPTALVADPSGALWAADWTTASVLRVNPADEFDDLFALDHVARALALDDAGHLYVTAGDGGEISQLDRDSGEVQWLQDVGIESRAVATTEDGGVWVAVPGVRAVQRLSAAGAIQSTVQLVGNPTALAVDAAGKVWAIGAASASIERLDPTTNRTDLVTGLVDGTGFDAVGDLSGVVARSIVSRIGTWRVVFDSAAAATPWGTLDWSASEPGDTEIRVRVRSSEDQEVWSDWESAVDGEALTATPTGRYLQIEAALQVLSGTDLPVLDELTVTPAAAVDPPVAAFTWTPADPVAGTAVQFSDTSTGTPETWSWAFGDGTTSSDQNPSHGFATAGTFTVGLTVTNSAGSDTTSADVTVRATGGCELECTATVPAAATAGEAAAFVATATATGCQGSVSYAWWLGDGATAQQASVDHSFAASGRYQWRLVASADGQLCTREGAIAIGDDVAMCSRPRWVAVASHANGENGSVWRTDLGVLGIAGDGGTFEVRLHAADGVTSRQQTVAPGTMVDIPDVVQWVRAGAVLSGAIQVCSDDELVVTSRTFNRLASDDPCLAGGTFGQRVDGVEAATGLAAGDVAVLPQLRENTSFRTNIGFTNAGSVAAELNVTLRDATGRSLVTYPVTLAPGAWRQDPSPFERRAGVSQLLAGSARIEVTSGAGVLVYASVIDNTTNDASTVLPQRVE